MAWIVQVFRHYPELAVFFTLALGFWLGHRKIGKFRLGSVTGVLLVGIIVGRMGIEIPEDAKSLFFLLFLFTVGYGVGPQFFEGLKKDGLKQAGFAAIVCVISLVTAWLMSKWYGFDSGTGAGLLAGANTSSSIIGIASDTINNMEINDAGKKALMNNVPMAYAVTYVFGTAGVSWFLCVIGPKILGGNIEEKVKELEAKLGSKGNEEDVQTQTAFEHVLFRAYHLQNDWIGKGKKVTEIEEHLKQQGRRIYILRVRNHSGLMDSNPDLIIKNGDAIAVSGQSQYIIGLEDLLGDEVVDMELLHFPIEQRVVIITNKDVIGKEAREVVSQSYFHGIGFRSLTRAGIEMPPVPGLILKKGDVVTMVGTKEELDKAISHVGYAEKAGNTTDIVFIAIGIVLGGFFGALAIHFGNVAISMSTSGGAIIAGLVFGWLRSQKPVFGHIPAPAQWLLTTLGLNVFIAIIGISASASFIDGLKHLGLELFIAGVIVSMVPMIAGLLLGRFLFKFHPVITLGACAGAHTESAALGALQDTLKSKTPALGYTVTYAVANIILATWGVIIVLLLHK